MDYSAGKTVRKSKDTEKGTCVIHFILYTIYKLYFSFDYTKFDLIQVFQEKKDADIGDK